MSKVCSGSPGATPDIGLARISPLPSQINRQASLVRQKGDFPSLLDLWLACCIFRTVSRSFEAFEFFDCQMVNAQRFHLFFVLLHYLISRVEIEAARTSARPIPTVLSLLLGYLVSWSVTQVLECPSIHVPLFRSAPSIFMSN